jgi:L-rhamnose-H+ transport protein
LNYAIAIGISAGLGTLAPLIYHPNEGFVWKIVDKFSNLPGWIILAGILLSLVGIAFCGWAGALRERSVGSGPSRYSFKIGVPLAILAGVFSAVFNYALLAGDPLAKAAFGAGSSDLLKMNAIYPFSNGGAWVVSAAWCIYLMFRNKSGSQLIQLPGAGAGKLGFYYLMALLSGAFWYFQFFFYGMGQAFIGSRNEHTSWALHMAMLILFSNVYGVLFREWTDAGRKARWTLQAGMAIIVIATIIIAIGLHLSKQLPASQ